MKFKYSEYRGPNNEKIFRPTLPVLFKHQTKFIQVEALVDSGADFTILPLEMAGIFGLKLDLKSKTKFYGAGNNSFPVYPSPEKIEHLIRKGGYRSYKWKAPVFFGESQPGILLGQKGFLDRFKITFNGRAKELEIHEGPLV